MNVQMLLTMGLSLAVILPIVYLFLEKLDQKSKIYNNDGVSLYLKKSQNNPFVSLYDFFLRFPITRGYIEKISRRYEILCPGKPRDIATKTMTLTLTTFFACIAEIFLIYLLNPNTLNFVLAVYLIFVINNEVINSYISKADTELLEQEELFISNVSHNYYKNFMIDEAISDSITNKMSEDMKVYASMLYAIVTSDNMIEEVEKFNVSSQNKYMKMFLSLCINVMEHGDKDKNGQRLLSANLLNLKREINLERLKLIKLRFVFSGSIFAVIAACVPLSIIKSFAISMQPTLRMFYEGKLGILSVIAIYFSSIIMYMIINYAKEINKPIPRSNKYLEQIEKLRFVKAALNNFTEKHYGRVEMLSQTLKRLGENISPRQLLLKSCLLSIFILILSISAIFYIHGKNRDLLTEVAKNTSSLTSASTEEQEAAISDTVLQLVNQYKDNDEVTQVLILKELGKREVLYNDLIKEQIAKEVINRVHRYQMEYFKWYELLISFALSILAFFTPYIMICFRKRMLTNRMEDEVLQFNSIIYMMMYTSQVTVMSILEQMELFAVVYKSSIQESINDYNSGDIEALTKLKEREAYEPFLRLVDNLIRCDDISIEIAFDELAADRDNYYERRKQEEDISTQKKKDNIKPFVVIPVFLTLAYLIAPLLVSSLSDMYEMFQMMKTMSYY